MGKWKKDEFSGQQNPKYAPVEWTPIDYLKILGNDTLPKVDTYYVGKEKNIVKSTPEVAVTSTNLKKNITIHDLIENPYLMEHPSKYNNTS